MFAFATSAAFMLNHQKPTRSALRASAAPGGAAVGNSSASLPIVRRGGTPASLQRLADVDSRFTTIAGVTMHHKSWLPEDADDARYALVCIHGFGASLFSFEFCAMSLCRTIPVAAMDITGFGLTQRPSLRHLWRYSPPFNATLVNELPLRSSITGRVLVAHSMGALIALEAAQLARQGSGVPLAGIVLVAPAIDLPSRSALMLRRVSSFAAAIFVLITLLSSPLIVPLLRKFVSSRGFWESGLGLARGDSDDKSPPEIVDGYMRPLGVDGWERGILNFIRCMTLYRSLNAGNALRILSDVASEIPVLVLHGQADRIIPISNSRAVKKKVPQIEFIELPKLGHVPHEERPEEFANFVDEFVKGLESPGYKIGVSSTYGTTQSEERDIPSQYPRSDGTALA